MNIVMKANNENSFPVRLPAEWEDTAAVIIAWPHCDTDWAYMLDDVCVCYQTLTRTLLRYDIPTIIVTPEPENVKTALNDIASSSKLAIFKCNTNDTWARDFGVITTISATGAPIVNDFKFNGWGLKFAANYDNLITSTMCTAGIFDRLFDTKPAYNNCLGFVLEGGSIESDGNGTLMTTSRCLLSPNRNGDLSQDDIVARLKNFFGISRILWVDYGELAGDDTDAHIDTLARFAPNDTIVFCGCDNPHDEHYASLSAMAEQLATFTTTSGKPYKLVPLPLPDPIYDEDGERLPATYANFLVTSTCVLMPTYAQPDKDRVAAELLSQIFANRDVIGIDCRALIRQHGSLHCITMQVPKSHTING